MSPTLNLLATALLVSSSTNYCCVEAAPNSQTHTPGRPRFSWETLPVFFHGANMSGRAFSPAAAAAIAKYPMATFEKSYARYMANGSTQGEEEATPVACRWVNGLSNGQTDTFFYLNSVIDWPFNEKLHNMMVANPDWRLKGNNGSDIHVVGNNWAYNLSNTDMRAAWVGECAAAVEAGCTGCFIDQANVREGIPGGPSATSPKGKQYAAAHLLALTELDARLAPNGYAIYNHLGVTNYSTHTMMIEDFTGTEKCVTELMTITARGITIQAHAGNNPKGNMCINGDTNAMAAFLVGAGNYSYYHCSASPTTWGSNPAWPKEHDSWLDWLPEYDVPLGAPLALASSTPSPHSSAAANAHVWTRSFASGTHVVFDGGSGNGTIYWSNGVVHTGEPSGPLPDGCKWESI
eukprot:m.107592 g.107592  ORF g.107592 m.107592 type:complete len:406 (+) comp27809_c0_seq1:200-1417(+)